MSSLALLFLVFTHWWFPAGKMVVTLQRCKGNGVGPVISLCLLRKKLLMICALHAEVNTATLILDEIIVSLGLTNTGLEYRLMLMN